MGPTNAPVARRIFDGAIARRSATGIRRGLDRDGVPPPGPKNKKDPKTGRWCNITITGIIHNPQCAGSIAGGVNSKSGEPPVIAPGRHGPILSFEKFELVGKIPAGKAREVTHTR